ncbi:anthranilate phosphoribosyltransferase [Aminomonas paucivorans DSM 12260]|uniref:Anthranilate phosphoribosyltransferase n=1 Tax=Aminomonas paucivorans DSM 12260 TaxID=584708 RepID=E3CVI3_9BACT|nr:anthranilate phosphoribosyltransferase [Aminomonas paucivorans]EFQ24174.1 anthranilate phosphoribosyltransferase [Aminomonas paucivorans DSM 12260]
MRQILEKLLRRENLTEGETRGALEALLEGAVPEAQVGAFLAALRSKGESREEIAAAARLLLDRATRVETGETTLLDVVGTGGDGGRTFNISTTVALVCAAAGVPVAKHGNRAVSGRCGSADVLEALGLPLLSEPEAIADSVRTTRFGFLFAPHFHRVLGKVGPARRALGVRTLFNLLGPLANPCGATHLLVGAPTPELVRPLAEALGLLGARGALVVHGHGGVDELSLSGPNQACRLEGGTVRDEVIRPEDAGLSPAPLEALAGGGGEENARILREILGGAPGPRRDVVVLNAAAALLVAGHASSLAEGAAQARRVLDSGAGTAKLAEVLAFARSREEGAA